MTHCHRPKIKQRALVLDHERCFYCGVGINTEGTYHGNEFYAVYDHKIPRCSGGDSSPENLLPSCKQCNTRKNRLSFDEYRRRLSSRTQFIEWHGRPFWGELSHDRDWLLV